MPAEGVLVVGDEVALRAVPDPARVEGGVGRDAGARRVRPRRGVRLQAAARGGVRGAPVGEHVGPEPVEVLDRQRHDVGEGEVAAGLQVALRERQLDDRGRRGDVRSALRGAPRVAVLEGADAVEGVAVLIASAADSWTVAKVNDPRENTIQTIAGTHIEALGVPRRHRPHVHTGEAVGLLFRSIRHQSA